MLGRVVALKIVVDESTHMTTVDAYMYLYSLHPWADCAGAMHLCNCGLSCTSIATYWHVARDLMYVCGGTNAAKFVCSGCGSKGNIVKIKNKLHTAAGSLQMMQTTECSSLSIFLQQISMIACVNLSCKNLTHHLIALHTMQSHPTHLLQLHMRITLEAIHQILLIVKASIDSLIGSVLTCLNVHGKLCPECEPSSLC